MLRSLIKRPLSTLFVAGSLLACSCSTFELLSLLLREPHVWGYPRESPWYRVATHLLWQAALAGACLTYEIRRRIAERSDPRMQKLTFVQWAPRWRQRKELRFVLYAFSAFQVSLIFVCVMETWRLYAYQRQEYGFAIPPLSEMTSRFLRDYGFSRMIGLIAAALAVAHDRYMLWLDDCGVAARCHVCGYDLRATPHRCPECGTERVDHFSKDASDQLADRFQRKPDSPIVAPGQQSSEEPK